MSLVPFLLNELLEESRRPTNFDLVDQHFGIGLADTFHHPQHQSHLHMPLRSGYIRPWRHVHAPESGVSTLVNNSKDFKVNLDVQQFKPEELKVTVHDGYIVVDGKHEERSDEHGFISRQFTRKYKLPEDINEKALASKLSSDGVLTLHAPKMIKADEKKARELTITHTNEPHKIKQDVKEIKAKTQDTMETN